MDVARLRAVLEIKDKLPEGLRGAASRLRSWATAQRGWSKPIAKDVEKSAAEIPEHLKKKLAEAEIAAKAFSKRIGDALAGGINKAGNALTLGVTLPILALGKSAITTAADFESLNSAMVAIYGSAEVANVQFKDMLKLSDQTGMGLQNLTKASMQLAAGFKGNRTAANFVLQEFSNIAATLKVSQADFERLTVNLTQIGPAAALAGDELKEMSSILPNFRPLLEEAFGTSSSEKIKKLGLTGQQVLLGLANAMKKMPRAPTDTFTAELNRLKNETTLLQKEFGEILLPLAKDMVKVLRDLTKQFSGLSAEQRQNIIKWFAIAAALGPVLKLTAGMINLIKGIIALRAAYVAATAAKAAANTALAASATAATGSLTALRLAYLGLAALAAVPIIITVKAVYDFKDAAEGALRSQERAAENSFSPDDYIKMKRGQGSKATNTELIEQFKKSRYYENFMNSGPGGKQGRENRDRAFEAREAAKKRAAEESEAMLKAIMDAQNQAMSGAIGKGGTKATKGPKEVAAEYDYWGRVIQKVATGFEPFRVSLLDVTGALSGSGDAVGRFSSELRAMIEKGDLEGARAAATAFVDSMGVAPAEIEGVMRAILDSLGEGNDEFRAKVAASIGEARNMSDAAKGAFIAFARIRDAETQQAKGAEIRAAYTKQVGELNAEFQKLNATTEQQTALLDLQNSETWPKLNAWQRIILAGLVARNIKTKENIDAEKRRKELADQMATTFANEVKGMRERIALMGVESEAGRMLYRVREGDLAQLSKFQKMILVAKAQSVDFQQGARDVAKGFFEALKQAQQEAAAANDQGIANADQYVADMKNRLLELAGAYDKLFEAEVRASLSGISDPKERAKRTQDILDLKKVVDKATEVYQIIDRVAGQAADAFLNAFAEIGKGFDAFAGSLLAGVQQMLNEIAAEIVRSELKRFFVGLLKGAFGANSGFEGKAMGGPVAAGVPYIVGEEGPELFVPGGAGNIVPAKQTAAMAGGGITVINHITVHAKDAGSFKHASGQIAADMGNLTRQQLDRDYGKHRGKR